jgi:hypothetical protein
MRSFAHVIAVGCVLSAAPASAEDLDAALRHVLREALEAHAPIPSDAPRLLEPGARPAPGGEAPPPSDDALAAAEESRRAALEKAVESAAALAQEAIGQVAGSGPTTAASATESERESESAVGISRAAEDRGSVIPLPLDPPVPDPRTPSTPLQQSGGQDGP